MNTLMMVAQTEGGGGMGGMGGMLLPMILIFGIMYVMLIRPNQRKEKERQKTISELRAGERIMFSGGLIGTVTEVRQHTFVVEVAPKVNMEIARGAVGQVLAKDEAPIVSNK
jgi:preprotein translocase subunit YajC